MTHGPRPPQVSANITFGWDQGALEEGFSQVIVVQCHACLLAREVIELRFELFKKRRISLRFCLFFQ